MSSLQQDAQSDHRFEEQVSSITAGNLISETFDVFASNASSFLAIMFICSSPALIVALLQVAKILPLFSPLIALLSLLTFVFMIAGQGAVTFGTVRYLAGYEPMMKENLSRGFSTFFSVILVSIVAMIFIGFGFMLFLIPGFILLMNYFVMVPVAVVENHGIFDTLKRSKELMMGYRSTIFGAVFVIGLLQGVISGGMQYAMVVLLRQPGESLIMAFGHAQMHPATSLVSLLLTILFSALYATMISVIYVRLRNERDGVDAVELSRVFQ